MNKDMLAELDRFFAQKTVVDADRNTFLICNLKDKNNKLMISLVFLRDWDSLEPNDYNALAIGNNGAVITFPCYWVSIPKELCIPYFIAILKQVYKENNWTFEEDDDSTGTINPSNPSAGNNCCCGNINGRNPSSYLNQAAPVAPCGVV